MVPEVVGTIGMSSASMGMDQGMWNWGASSRITMFLRETYPFLFRVRHFFFVEALIFDHLPQNFGTIVVVLHGVLYKAEAIDVADKWMSVCSEKVKSADCLLEDVKVKYAKWHHSIFIFVFRILLTLNARHTFLATSFSIAVSMTGYRISFPSLSRSTLPSRAGDLRASAWA